MANYIKNFFGKFAKSKSSKSKVTTEVIEVNTGNKLSYAGYQQGDTVTQEQQASALLTDLRSKSNIGEQIETIEYWQYINPPFFEINPEEGFEFANELYQGCDIWNLFLSGSARMNYYEEKDTDLEQRIKYAIVEYMVRRPQFYSIDDFYDNEILHRKYGKKNKNGGDKECQK